MILKNVAEKRDLTKSQNILMTEILPDLWLYKSRDSKNLVNVFHINCDNDLKFLTNAPDKLIEELKQFYEYTLYKVKTIHEYLKDNRTVVVSCKTGRHLSQIVVAAYLIKYGKLSPGDAMNAMKSKNGELFEGTIYYSQVLEKMALSLPR
jgi:protein-tyrosine phosphatase